MTAADRSAANNYTGALVRPPGDSFARALSSTGARIDPAVARSQHREYCQALAAAGFSVEALPVDERHPDSTFMQDPALVVAGRAILCRMGAPSRAGETAAVEPWLESHFPTERIAAPGTLEGGDVLLMPGKLLVGASARTNAAGIAQLAAFVRGAGIAVVPVPVTKYLHLLSAATYIGRNTLLALPDHADHPAFQGLEVVTVGFDEAHAADALATGDKVILPAGHPRIAADLRARGFEVIAVPMSAFAAADGGVTCLSLVW